MKRFFETIVEKILMASGAITSLTILLIIIFLFSQGAGLFNTPVVEEGYKLAVNPENPVSDLTPEEIKEIFDGEIVNWAQVGGDDEDIVVFRLNDVTSYVSEEELGEGYSLLPQCLSRIVSENKPIIAFLPDTYIPENFSGKILETGDIKPSDFFAGEQWFPTSQPAPLFGIIPLLLGTLLVSVAAILFALPLGLAVAIYMAELASTKMRNILKPVIELLAGIPSVVYGFFGLVVIVPMIHDFFDLPVGESGLAGAIVLAIMALPTVITVAEDAIRSVPRTTKEASLALGASHLQTIFRVILPYSVSGIMAAVVLGIGRAIGETMAVLMVTGNSAVIPTTLLEPVRTIPATIAAELGEAPSGGAHYEALFMLGVILFIITLAISITVEFISARRPKQQM
ncbi:MAG: phosphate ABC transporter permease subunit PstC [Bacteroidetes bacterium]|uniref:Phosphate transport system permease protein n=1 Tax=Candidatus Caccoplasma merdipullorum TaxID=2840718 RepID=A0A9D9H5Y9_9BACT|nr:phosphate ABC transporter permease subunit PstC [Candidatus Caccoplasma merdipullorum]